MIQMSKPDVGAEEIQTITEVFKDGYLGCGTYVNKFEEELKRYLNREVVCVSSGTSALHLSLEALDIGSGCEVIVQSLTFIATFQAVAVTGARVIPCDINTDDLSIDLADAKKKITKRTKAIIPVHYAGYPGNLEQVYNFAKKYNIRVIEDAAHSFGGRYKGKPIGFSGDVVCFSFDPVKIITCGEGGAIISDDDQVISRVKDMRSLGLKKCITEIDKTTTVNGPGWRYHMSNINAAIGLEQYKKLDHFLDVRQSLASLYVSLLKNNKYIDLLPYDYQSISPYIFVVRLKNIERTAVIEEMRQRGVECGYHYYPPHLNPYFRNFYSESLPAVEKVYKSLLTLPLHTGITDKNVRVVVENLEDVLKNKEALELVSG
jgi:dTDP-4-amino-4,6-dideoxygalactose transaminase